VLYARAYGAPEADERARALERTLRSEKLPLDWLTREWITPALAGV
jgi:hypothetical protein